MKVFRRFVEFGSSALSRINSTELESSSSLEISESSDVPISGVTSSISAADDDSGYESEIAIDDDEPDISGDAGYSLNGLSRSSFSCSCCGETFQFLNRENPQNHA